MWTEGVAPVLVPVPELQFRMGAIASIKPKILFTYPQADEKMAVALDESLGVRGAGPAQTEDKPSRIRLDVAAEVVQQRWGVLVLHNEIPNLQRELSRQLLAPRLAVWSGTHLALVNRRYVAVECMDDGDGPILTSED